MSIRYRVTTWFAVRKYHLRQRIRKWLDIGLPRVSVYARLIGGPHDLRTHEIDLLDLPETIHCSMLSHRYVSFFTHDDAPVTPQWPKFGTAVYRRVPEVISQIPILYQFEECIDV